MTTQNPDDQKRAKLERQGVLRLGRGKVRERIVDTPPPSLPDDMSVLDLLLEERKEGR